MNEERYLEFPLRGENGERDIGMRMLLDADSILALTQSIDPDSKDVRVVLTFSVTFTEAQHALLDMSYADAYERLTGLRPTEKHV